MRQKKGVKRTRKEEEALGGNIRNMGKYRKEHKRVKPRQTKVERDK